MDFATFLRLFDKEKGAFAASQTVENHPNRSAANWAAAMAEVVTKAYDVEDRAAKAAEDDGA